MKTAADFLRDPQLFTTSAIVLLTDRFGPEFMDWDPVTVGMEIEAEYGIEPIAELQDRIQAGSSLYTTDLFFVSLETFSPVCNALNFGTATSQIMLPADLDDVLWGCTEALILLGEIYEAAQFSHNIALYVGALLSQAGIVKPPKILAFAEYSDDMVLRSDAAFEGDETMRMSFWKDQEHEREMLEKWNQSKIVALMKQLEALPLRNGNTDFIRKTREKLKRLEQDGRQAPVAS